jgi:hypothetical protein
MPLPTSRPARRFAAGIAVTASVGLLAAACDYGPDGDPEILGLAGDITTHDVMGSIFAAYDANLTYNDDPAIPGDDRDTLRNHLSGDLVNDPEDCPDAAYAAPPDTSGAGLDALKASFLAGDGCIDFARSTLTPRPIGGGPGQDPAEFEYYAYGLDILGYSTASALASANLTLAQLRGIYNCTFTNWNQVGGGNGPILRYWPPPGSGQRARFQAEFLGFDPTIVSTPTCPLPIVTPVDTGAFVAANGHEAQAIMPFSATAWMAMANGVAPDQRFGQRIGSLDGKNVTLFTGPGFVPATPAATGDPTAPVQESNVKLVNPAAPTRASGSCSTSWPTARPATRARCATSASTTCPTAGPHRFAAVRTRPRSSCSASARCLAAAPPPPPAGSTDGGRPVPTPFRPGTNAIE